MYEGDTSGKSITIEDLEDYSTYKVTVTSMNEVGEESVSAYGTTAEDGMFNVCFMSLLLPRTFFQKSGSNLLQYLIR